VRHANENFEFRRVEFALKTLCLATLWRYDTTRSTAPGPPRKPAAEGEGHEMREAEIEKLERRLRALEQIHVQHERTFRRWKRQRILVCACLPVVALAGAADLRQSTIEAKEFVLRDDSGSMRASLAIRPDGTPGLGLFDKGGKVRLSLDMSADGDGSLNLHDASGNLRAAIAIRPDGTPGVGLFGNKGQARASLDVGPDGSSGVNVYNDEGTLRAAMAVRADTTPAIGLFDTHGVVVRSIEPPCTKESNVSSAKK